MTVCKNCVFWQPFRGEETTMPRRSSHACTARVYHFTDDNGEKQVAITSMRQVRSIDKVTRTNILADTEPGPFYGQRTKPKHTCQAARAKHKPKLKAVVPAIPKVV